MNVFFEHISLCDSIDFLVSTCFLTLLLFSYCFNMVINYAASAFTEAYLLRRIKQSRPIKCFMHNSIRGKKPNPIIKAFLHISIMQKLELL